MRVGVLVEHHHHLLVVKIAEIDVDRVLRQEVRESAAMHCRGIPAPVEQRAHKVLRLPLLLRQSPSGDGIDGVAFPAAREVAADDAVVAAAADQQFGSIVDLRRPAHRGQVGHGQFEQRVILAELAVDAPHVVVVAENDQFVGVRIKDIVRQHRVEGSKTVGKPFLGHQ